MTTEVTRLLESWNEGDDLARSRLISLVHEELRTIAAGALRHERTPDLLQPTALVNEAYLKLVDTDRIDWQGRAHFLSMAGRLMRQILVDQARHQRASKRDWGQRVTLTGKAWRGEALNVDTLALDAALDELAELRPDLSDLVEWRFFGGLTVEQCANLANVSARTIKRRWRSAQTWLARELSEDR